MGLTGLNMENIKKNNRSSILRLINSEGPISKKDIAAALELTPAAVTLICSDFLASGLLIERGEREETQVRAGRKKVLIDINPDYCYIYGINIDPEQTTVALCDLKGNAKMVFQSETNTKLTPDEFFEEISRQCKSLQEKSKIAKEKIAGAGVGITGIVERSTGESTKAYGIFEQPVSVGQILTKQLNLPVVVENNVNAFALAEMLFGVGKKYDNILLVKWGPGVGSSIIIDGKIYEGRHGKAAELGHFIVEKDGKPCQCGRRGCLETRASRQAIRELLPKLQLEPESFSTIVFAPKEEEILGEILDLFSRTIVNSATILAPNRVVLYGKMFENPWLRENLIARCGSYDEGFSEGRVLYSGLAVKEDYIGPVALFISDQIF